MIGRITNALRLFLAVLLFSFVTSNFYKQDCDGNTLDDLETSEGGNYYLFKEKLIQPVENPSWREPENVGQISGVAVDLSGNPVIFHRGDRIWNYDTFDEKDEYREKYRGPIAQNTVLTLDRVTGEVMHGWGNGIFYLPHGIHIDGSDNVWLTDVARHQVMQFDSFGTPLLILGERFVPGSDLQHFCKPTSVAVAPTGEVVVADGYCNHRLVILDSNGNPKRSIGEPWISLRIPHGLAFLPNGELCVADRENRRVLCLDTNFSEETKEAERPHSIRNRQLGPVFGIASTGEYIYGVSGPSSRKKIPRGFTMSASNRTIINFWGPKLTIPLQTFTQPHAIAAAQNALYVAEIGPNKLWKFDLIRARLCWKMDRRYPSSD